MNSNFIKLHTTVNKLRFWLRIKNRLYMSGLKNKSGKRPSFLAAVGSLREIVVVLPYSEPHRGGFQAQQYVIQLDMLKRIQKQVVVQHVRNNNRAS